MGRSKQRKQKNSKRNKGNNQKGSAPQALQRPMQGMDQKTFALNDIVPVLLPDPQNSTTFTVIIQCDVNGWTYDIVNASGQTVQSQSAAYGNRTDQFQTQAMFYTQYYLHTVDFDLSLSQGGSTYSMSPLVHLKNPNGQSPFILGTGGFQDLISSPNMTNVLQPYARHRHHITYSKWLMAMTDRCWRKTIADPAVSNSREFYPSDGSQITDFVVPAQVSAFQITIPEGTFDPNAGDFVVGIFKTRAHYVFSQRRTNIENVVNQAVIRQIETTIENPKDEKARKLKSERKCFG